MSLAVVVTTKGFDVMLVVHVLLAVTAFVALLVLRGAAQAVVRGGELAATSLRSFTGRRELAGRVVHLVPLSGICLIALSRGAYALESGFVDAGLALWFVAASVLEGVGFPAQRSVADALENGEDPVPAARRVLLACDVACLTLIVAAVVMVTAN